eukprot:TRINITY_DN4620_c0_g1_i1.p1 TRINITY_DN4620_c0_g1~~TRINITY_DN4620_c0_g1_i1.p1  ORF type:complete len:454 (-),score=171.21 TRINITY_DN4620_c0_g1_i1:74-1435(-)
MSRIVRASKYRHVFGTPAKTEQCYNGVKVSNTAWDTNFIAANPKYFAMMWESAGGGCVAVVNLDHAGKLSAGDMPLLTGHKAAVLDLDWNPFNDNLLASCSEDCNIFVWGIPEGGLKENMSTPLQTLQGHKRKVGTCNFHPCANNVLATSSADYTVKVWDIEKGDEMFSVGGATDLIMSCVWNKNGSNLATVSKDKKLRIIDPRTTTTVHEAACHQGSKGMRVNWMGKYDKILTTGFSKNSEREFFIWDPKNMSEPLAHNMIDSMSGCIMPFYDEESSMLYLAGKGDGNIRYYEIVDEKPYFYLLSEYKSSTSQRGCCMMPKRSLNVAGCEIARLLKVSQAKMVEPISFTVPRKSEIFQDDLYPNTFAGIPTETAEEWKNGANNAPDCSFSHEKGFVAPVHATEFKPVVKEAEKPKSEKELRDDNEQLRNRVSYLEAEVARRDARIKELEATH